jgi:hypothetical protein
MALAACGGDESMTTSKDLLGVWNGTAMCENRAQSYDVLVFKEDGTGFLDLYDTVHRFSESFGWSFEPPDQLRLEGTQLMQFNPERRAFEERMTTLNAIVPLSIREEYTWARGMVPVLRMADRPWPGMSDHYLFYDEDIPILATFQVPCFLLAEESAASPFRGKALSDYLAQQLQARHVPVGERYEVFFGCCYYRGVEIGGRMLGLAVNGEKNSQGWWLRIDRPATGGTAEAVELYHMLVDILGNVEGLHSLTWQTEAELHGRPPAPK